MDSSLANTLAARDLAVVWHPCTQMHDHETLPMVPIASAEGTWLHGHDGRRYLDAVSSWWTCLLGHRHRFHSNRLFLQACRDSYDSFLRLRDSERKRRHLDLFIRPCRRGRSRQCLTTQDRARTGPIPSLARDSAVPGRSLSAIFPDRRPCSKKRQQLPDALKDRRLVLQ